MRPHEHIVASVKDFVKDSLSFRGGKPPGLTMSAGVTHVYNVVAIEDALVAAVPCSARLREVEQRLENEVSKLNAERQLQQQVVQRIAQLEAANERLQKEIEERRRIEEDLRARNRQQAALAQLGQTAILGWNLAAVVDETAAVVAETLDTEYCAVLERLPDRQELILRAGIGWKPGLVGRHTVSAVAGTAGGFILRSDAPVVIPDMRQETRFERPTILLDHGVISGMNVIIRGRACPWGVLGVHTTRPRSFNLDEVGFLQSVANMLSLAVERHEHEVARWREKEILEAIFDNIPVMISFFDASGRLSHVNHEWERVLGWTLEEAQRRDILAEAYPDPERRREALEFILKAERRWADFRVRARDGRIVDASWARFALSDGSRIGFGLDMTVRKRAEETLRESESRFRQLAETIDEVFWLANHGAELLYVSPRYERVFGRSRESLYRDPRSWLEAVHCEDRERVQRAVEKKGAGGETDETYRVLRPDG